MNLFHNCHSGEKDGWDEGAIWFPTVEKISGRYFMWYEGYGGGTARTETYGSYLKGGKSQVGAWPRSMRRIPTLQRNIPEWRIV